MRPIIVVAGTGSNVGKTTLVCRLLHHLEEWEAIKVTRGHYRSCGRDPDICCVSDLLGDAPRIISERHQTDIPGKDTGRFWQAGATQVHWLVATSAQIESGIAHALELVTAPGAIVEGTSILQFIKPALAILVTSGTEPRIKPTARKALTDGRIDLIYTADDSLTFRTAVDGSGRTAEDLPQFGPSTFPNLLEFVQHSLDLKPFAPIVHSLR